MEKHDHDHDGLGPHTHDHADGDTATHSHGGHTHAHENTKVVKNRLARIVGHLHAIERMIDDGRDCPEVLIQLAAVRSALGSVSRVILRDHMEHCIVDAIESGDKKALEDMESAIDMLMK